MIAPLAYALLGITSHCLMLHPSSETLAELQWNESTGRIEIALRLSQADAGTLLGAIDQTLETTPSAQRVAIESVSGQQLALGRWLWFDRHPACRPGDPLLNARRYHFIGHRDEGAHVWWFAEYQPDRIDGPDRLSGLTPPPHVRSLLLQPITAASRDAHFGFAHDSDQSTFVLLGGRSPRSITLDAKKTTGQLPWPWRQDES